MVSFLIGWALTCFPLSTNKELQMNLNPNHPPIRVQPPLVLLANVVLGFILKAFFPAPITERKKSRPVTIALGLPLLLGGLLLGGSAVRGMVHAGTSPDPHRPVNELVTGGPYRFTRNPIYLGFALIVLSLGLLANSLWFIPLAAGYIMTIQTQVIRYEEQYLETKFGPRYQEYKGQVRQWIGRHR